MALYTFHQDPGLDQPALIVSLEGWIDAGGGAATATEMIRQAPDPIPVATFDSDALLDHRARRPVMHLVDGVNTGLTWPTIELTAVEDTRGRAALLLTGPEPDHSWPSFATAVIDLAESFEVAEVVGLGAYPAPVPHTRPVLLSCTASSKEVAARHAVVRGNLDVPAGVAAAIEVQARDAGMTALGLWAQVPHYAAALPYPGAALRLLEALDEVVGLHFDPGDLDRQAQATATRLDELVAGSEEHQELVRQLEVHIDQTLAADDLGLTSGDELAAEVERFLREQQGD